MGHRSLIEKLAHKLGRSFSHRRRRIPQRIEDSPQPQSTARRMLSFIVPLLALAYAFFTTPVYSGNADLWRQQSIYQVFLPWNSTHIRLSLIDSPSGEGILNLVTLQPNSIAEVIGKESLTNWTISKAWALQQYGSHLYTSTKRH
jgi:hypothetical protein